MDRLLKINFPDNIKPHDEIITDTVTAIHRFFGRDDIEIEEIPDQQAEIDRLREVLRDCQKLFDKITDDWGPNAREKDYDGAMDMMDNIDVICPEEVKSE